MLSSSSLSAAPSYFFAQQCHKVSLHTILIGVMGTNCKCHTELPLSKLGKEKRKKKRKDHANKVTPVCVNKGRILRSLHLVQAPGKLPPSNEEKGH